MFAREKVLLKRYLKESNLNENLAYTPTTTVHALRSRSRDDVRAPLESISISPHRSNSLSNQLSISPSPFNSSGKKGKLAYSQLKC